MPVFRMNVLSELDTALTKIAEKFFNKTALILSPDEFIDAFVWPEHLPILREAQSIVGSVGSTSTVTSIAPINMDYQLKGSLAFYGVPPVPLPLYVQTGMQPNASVATAHKIRSWAADRLKFGAAFGTVRDAIGTLNEECGDTRAMSLCLPCLPQLLAETSDDPDNYLVKRARRLAQRSNVPKLPRLSPSTKASLLEASSMVQAAAMALSAPDLDVKGGECLLRVHGAGTVPVPNVFTGSPDGGAFV